MPRPGSEAFAAVCRKTRRLEHVMEKPFRLQGVADAIKLSETLRADMLSTRLFRQSPGKFLSDFLWHTGRF
ncbi:MAG: hypothetical protein EBX30_09940 [Betaproteobacteria bacterium]|nr:hypothetical protein [Betaproteobacteria bacterium]HAB47131.1 hypothetical protein [Lautropia sp.]